MDKHIIESLPLTFHHIGLLVQSIQESIPHYSNLFGKESISETIKVSSQNVNVCFVKISENSYIELVEPVGENSQVQKMLKKGTSYYHIGYKVFNLDATVSQLERMNYKAMKSFSSEAFNGKRCIFLFSPQVHLIELIEH